MYADCRVIVTQQFTIWYTAVGRHIIITKRLDRMSHISAHLSIINIDDRRNQALFLSSLLMIEGNEEHFPLNQVWSTTHLFNGSTNEYPTTCLSRYLMYVDVTERSNRMSNIGAHLISSILMIGGTITVDDRSKWWLWSHTHRTFVQAVWRGGTLFNNPPTSLSSSQLSSTCLAGRNIV